MGNELVGYSFCGVGLLSLLCSFERVNSFFANYLPQISKFPSLTFQIFGGFFLLIGILLLSKKGGKGKVSLEVPIYQGDRIVGYRRNK